MSDQDQALQNISDIKTKLTTLKRDRANFIKSSEVLELYDEFAKQIKILLDTYSPNLPPHKIDDILEDVFQLMSLALLTVGHNRKAPAAFASLCAVQRLLEHLDESSTYTEQDVQPIRERVEEISKLVQREDSQEEPQEIINLLTHKLKVCKESLVSVEKSLEDIEPGLQPIMQRLVHIRREIMAICSRPKFKPQTLKPLEQEVAKIESKRVNGKFLNEDGSLPQGQATVNGLLEKCSTLISDFSASSSEDYVDPSLKGVYSQLLEMKTALENLLVTHRWTMRETDLYFYQKKLAEIDNMRVGGIFRTSSPMTSVSHTPVVEQIKDEEGVGKSSSNNISSSDGSSTPIGAPKGQSILLYLLRRCYAIIYKLLESSEPVSEALTPVRNQLSTVRRCLLEVKRNGGLSSVRELYPYQMKLASIDQLRTDGKFFVGDSLPEGQGMLNALLAECFDICHELKVEMDERD